jgi:hypothetical protein
VSYKYLISFDFDEDVTHSECGTDCAEDNEVMYLKWKQEYSEKTIDLSQVTDKLYHMKYTSPRVGFELTILLMIGTDCTDSCKPNNDTMTITTTPLSDWSPCDSIMKRTQDASGEELNSTIQRVFKYITSLSSAQSVPHSE